MANSYSIAPGNVFGKLTTTDDISAASGQTARAHINSTGTLAGVGFNVNAANLTRDDVTRPAAQIFFDAATGVLEGQFITAGGTNKRGAIPRVCLNNNQAAANTGNTTENVIFGSNIMAGEMGVYGVVRVLVYVSTTVQGGVASTLRVKLGAAIIGSASITTVAQRLLEVLVGNTGVANAQRSCGITHTDAAAVSVGTVATAVDTSVIQGLIITLQNGAVTDSHVVQLAHGIITPESAVV